MGFEWRRHMPCDERDKIPAYLQILPFCYTFLIYDPQAHTHALNTCSPVHWEGFPLSVHTGRRHGNIHPVRMAAPQPRPGPDTEWVVGCPHPSLCKKGTCNRQSHICGAEDSHITHCWLIIPSSRKALNFFQNSSGSSCGLGSDPCPTPFTPVDWEVVYLV